MSGKRESIGGIDLQWSGDGLFDELLADQVSIHIERMNDGTIWFRISTKDDRRGSVAGNFIRKDGKKIDVVFTEKVHPTGDTQHG